MRRSVTMVILSISRLCKTAWRLDPYRRLCLKAPENRRALRLTVVVIGLFFLLTHAAIAAFPFPQRAPVNPEYVKYKETLRTMAYWRFQTEEGYALGLVPSPVDFSRVTATPIREVSPRDVLSLPSSYDLRTLGRVTAVRDQGGCGSCWAFGAIASLESWLLTAAVGAWDLSENNFKECHGFAYGPCEGGNRFMSTAYFARRSGPVSEADDPYYPYATGCTAGLTVRKFLRDVSMPPNRTGSLDNDTIKQVVMDYGAMYTGMYWESAYYRSDESTYYYPGTLGSNHAVAIVGWDDNFDRTLFASQAPASLPPEDGAWIVRNSWGSGWGDGGYFYASYYDSKIGRGNAVFINATDPDATELYQYDSLGWVTNWGYSSNTAWGANVFTASSNGSITAVATYASTSNTAYEIMVKDGLNGSVLASKTGTWPFAGYHTVDLATPVSISLGDTFVIAVRYTTPGYNYPVPAECVDSWYSPAATANPGESYISSDGNTWSDIVTATWGDPTCNICIKAIVSPGPSTAVFRVDKTGNVYAEGSYYGAGFYTGSADVAEWVPVSEEVEPGDVLELDPDNPGHYRKTRGPCSTLVGGVVSTDPGVVLGSSPTLDIGPSTLDSALLALLGIVPVKVTDEGGPIEPGDLLVTSSLPGFAMKRNPASTASCDLVGKALESHRSGMGLIRVLLMH